MFKLEMLKNYKLIAFALWAAALAVGLTWSFDAKSSAQAPAPGARNGPGLTPQEKRGKALYLRGVSPSGNEVTAAVGEIDVPAATMTCAGCHGSDGRGKTEAGVAAGNITWTYLTRPEGHAHITGRRHGPFSEAAFVRALTVGRDPNGHELLRAMPRYRMSPGDAADLVAYLKRIDTDPDPGLTDSSITVGTVLPSRGQLGETGRAMREVLAAFFDDVNSRGGIYNRRIELRVADTGAGGDAAAVAAGTRRLLEDEQIFAFVGGITAGADREIAALSREAEVPFVGPSTLLPQTIFPLNPYVFYLLPGVGEQGRALVNFAAKRPGLLKSRARVVYTEDSFNAEVAAGIEEQARKLGWAETSRVAYARDPGGLARVVANLRREGAEVVFLLGPVGDEKAFIREADAIGWAPSLFLLGITTSRDLLEAVPARFGDKIFLSFPTVPSDITPEGLAQFRALTQRYGIAQRHTASQLSAFAAARLFVEALKQAGRELSREKLIATLEGLYEFDTGVTPRLTFGPNRRVGAAGAHVIVIDVAKRAYVPAGGWVAAN